MSARRRWVSLAVLVLPVLLISIDMTVLGIAVPALSDHLRPSSAELLWIIDLYSFVLAGLLVLMGSLGDRIGRRRLLVTGSIAFGIASVLAAFSTSSEMLILARGLLGLGGATLMPSTLALIRSIFTDPTQRRTAIAVWAAAFSGGAAIGPVIGGFLLEHFWWGSVFLMNTPVMILLVIGALLFIPESKDPNPGPFDPLSALMSIAGILPIVYAIKTAAKHPDLTALIALVIGVVILALFIRRQRQLPSPMIDLGLFTHRAFTVAVLVNLITVFAMAGEMFFLPQHLMLVLGKTPFEAGLWMVPLAAVTFAGALLSPRLARYLPIHTVVALGLGLTAAGFLLATQLSGGPSDLPIFVVSGVLMGLGVGLGETLTNDVILEVAPPERAGAASAISETGYEFGGAMGTAVLGSIGLAVYGAHLTTVPGASDSALTSARESLGEAHGVATSLSSQAGEHLTQVANSAFVQGLDVVMLCGAILSAGGALMAYTLMRQSAPAARDGAGDAHREAVKQG
ncbi:MFS transporter [Devriesea agamarum]|uniref:MFS transporter n=1 Tax=Devriesea agamarum TaxID=472569 RepID=UPI00071D32AF|nr:MFS transporter [Devriesea agamarum]